jgi:hypothetical protein
VRLRWKILQFGVFTALTLLANGCGGLRAQYGVSPLTFLLPGFGKVDAKPVDPNMDKQLNQPLDEPGKVVPSFVIERWDQVEVPPARDLTQVDNSQFNF